MKIIGFNLAKILAQRKEKLQGKLEIKQSINIDEVARDKINISDEEIIKIHFTFAIDYSPDMAKIEFQGILILIPEKDELKKITKDWKSKQISEEIREPIFNFIMHKSNIKAIALEDEMGLPPHIQMPKLSLNNNPQ